MRRTGVLAGFVMAGVLCLAGGAEATPFFEVVGGTVETQNFSGTQIIPNGAFGFENRLSGPGAISVFLRDTTAADGTLRTIVFDYVGTDAVFSNEFQNALSVPGGSVRWCNKPTAAGCDTSYTPLGSGNDDWFGNFAATATMTLAVGDLVPFAFIADALMDDGGPLSVINGQDAPGADDDNPRRAEAHMGVFNISGGAFNFLAANRLGTEFALGLTDGNFGPGDDDHQDFMVRLSAVPEPSVSLLGGFALGWLVVARRRFGRRVSP